MKALLLWSNKEMVFSEKSDLDFRPSSMLGCFVYFLKMGDEVVYVGQTRSGVSRPLSHKDKSFDSVSMISCPCEDLDKLESSMILKYQPIYNKTIPVGFTLGALKSAVRRRGFAACTLPTLKRYLRENKTPMTAINGLIYIGVEDSERVITGLTTRR